MHPLFELLLNPFAGAAQMNLIAMMFWATVFGCGFIAIVTKSFK